MTKYFWTEDEIAERRRELQGRPISDVSLEELAEIARWERAQFVNSDGQGNIGGSWDISQVKPMTEKEFLKKMRGF